MCMPAPTQAEEGQRERKRENLKQDPHPAQSPMSDSIIRTCEIMTGAKIKSWMLNPPSHPGTPRSPYLNIYVPRTTMGVSCKIFHFILTAHPGLIVRKELLDPPWDRQVNWELVWIHTSSKCWWQQTLLLTNYTVSVLFFLSKRTQTVERAETCQLWISPFQPTL